MQSKQDLSGKTLIKTNPVINDIAAKHAHVGTSKAETYPRSDKASISTISVSEKIQYTGSFIMCVQNWKNVILKFQS